MGSSSRRGNMQTVNVHFQCLGNILSSNLPLKSHWLEFQPHYHITDTSEVTGQKYSLATTEQYILIVIDHWIELQDGNHRTTNFNSHWLLFKTGCHSTYISTVTGLSSRLAITELTAAKEQHNCHRRKYQHNYHMQKVSTTASKQTQLLQQENQHNYHMEKVPTQLPHGDQSSRLAITELTFQRPSVRILGLLSQNSTFQWLWLDFQAGYHSIVHFNCHWLEFQAGYHRTVHFNITEQYTLTANGQKFRLPITKHPFQWLLDTGQVCNNKTVHSNDQWLVFEASNHRIQYILITTG